MNKIFISHANKHPIYAQLIIDQLKTENLVPWIDKMDLPRGKDWKAELMRAIREDCFALVVVVTQEAVESPIVQAEVETALASKKIIIPVIMERLDIPASLRQIDPQLEKINAVNCIDDGYKMGISQAIDRLKEALNDWADIERIINKLNHFSYMVRRPAIKELSAKNDNRVIEPLLNAMRIEPERTLIIEDFIPAIAQFRDDPRIYYCLMTYLANDGAIYSEDADTYQITKALGLHDEEDKSALETFLSVFSQYRNEQKLIMIKKLYNRLQSTRIREIGHAFLTELMKLENHRLQIQAIYTLKNHGGVEIVDELKSYLATTENERVRDTLLKAIFSLEQRQQQLATAAAKNEKRKNR